MGERTCKIPGCENAKVPGQGSKLCQEHRDEAAARRRESMRQWRAANREAINEQKRRWYTANRDKINGRQRPYREGNRDKIKERARQWYAENRERASERARLYYAGNREEIKRQTREYREANLEAARERGRQYHRANPEAQRRRTRRWRAANPEAVKESYQRYSASIRAAVFDHYGWACTCCGTTERLVIDHKDGDGRQHREELFGANEAGGLNMYRWIIANGFPGNLQTLCGPCNSSKRDGPHCRLDHGGTGG